MSSGQIGEAQPPRDKDILLGILKISSEAIIVADANARILMFSAGAEAIFGYSAEEILGQSIERLIPFRFRATHKQHMDQFAGGSGDGAGSLTLTCLRYGPTRRAAGDEGVAPISFKRHRFPADVIRQAVWLYFRFTLSIRDVEELLAQRGIEVSREAVRCWVNKFGPLIAANLRRRRSPPTGRWHLDEMVVKIAGRRMYLWRAVDDEGEVLDVLVQRRPNKHAALKLLRKLLKNQGVRPEAITTDKLASYRAAARDLGLSSRHRPGGMRENNRAENSHLAIRRRERKQQKFKSQGSAQRFLSSHSAVYNTFNTQPHLISRPGLRTLRAQAHREWAAATIAA